MLVQDPRALAALSLPVVLEHHVALSALCSLGLQLALLGQVRLCHPKQQEDGNLVRDGFGEFA